ncbi:anoctamin-5-like isoform X5 [Mizuhopecten yessoensis]|uniref:anoctamin-5-like isoform X5 n=1 Tax=Mizuhopecten yessoensis TaxID=6573 RepID=UPI000B45A4D0|nr:anoctamin-5-like isoform X5 [Mizuhopecten yessoensis]
MEPIGFEMHTGAQDQPAHVSQVNVEYPMNTPAAGQGVSPDPNEGSLYPVMEKDPSGPGPAPAPAPIGFEGHANGGPEDGRDESTAVDIEKSPEERHLEGEGELEQADTLLGGEEISQEEAKLLLEQQKIANEDATLFFRDGARKIDYVLAYEPGSPSEQEEKKREKRKIFEDNLRKEGLELEYEGKETSRSGKTCFVKVHAPWDVMTKYAELTNLKMPLAENDLEFELESYMEYCWNMFPSVFELDADIVKPEPNYFTAPFNRDRQDQFLKTYKKIEAFDRDDPAFVIKDKNSFFTNAQRSRMVHEILVRTVFDREDNDKGKHRFGITKMTSSGIYAAAFPLHDGRYTSEHSLLTRGKSNDRHLLYEVWARPGAW